MTQKERDAKYILSLLTNEPVQKESIYLTWAHKTKNMELRRRLTDKKQDCREHAIIDLHTGTMNDYWVGRWTIALRELRLSKKINVSRPMPGRPATIWKRKENVQK